MRWFQLAALVAALARATPVAPADESRRFFDFAPVSAGNPVVAIIDDSMQIPLSELRGYRDAERLHAITDPASLAQKRAVLEDLINEYLFVDEAYRSGVVNSPGFLRQMEATRTLLLTDFMAARASEGKSAPSAETSEPAAGALIDRLFEAAVIEVSNEAYDLLKSAARKIDAASAEARRGPVAVPDREAAARLHATIDGTPDAVLVRYEGKTISVRQILVLYAGLRETRPNIQTQEGFIALIKPLIIPELMALEAAKRGIEAEPAFQHKLTQNRNALLRFHAHGRIESQATEALKVHDLDARLEAWYRERTDFYAATAAADGKTVPSFSAVRERVLADYSVDLRDRLLAEKARALRAQHRVIVDDSLLGRF